MQPQPPGEPRVRPAANRSSLIIRNIVVGGHRTSVRLEPVMWDALHDIAAREGRNINDIVTEVDRDRTASTLTAAIRVYIVDYYWSLWLSTGERRLASAAD